MDPTDHVRFECGRHLARGFLTSEMIWLTKQFDSVDWDSLHSCLQSKQDGFRTWLAKQHSNLCATYMWMKRWFGNKDSLCPSCQLVDETADHLCQCTNLDRCRLLEEGTNNLVRWMSLGENTSPDIISWVEQYILRYDTFPSGHHHCPATIRDLV